jgi:hypothetical protein
MRSKTSGASKSQRLVALLALVALVGVAACQPQDPPVPTVRPDATRTTPPLDGTPTATSALSTEVSTEVSTAITPEVNSTPLSIPTMRVMVSATPGVTPTAPVVAMQPSPTFGPKCYTVKENETLLELIYRAGYATLDVLEEVRRVNNISGNNIRVGQQVCIPAFTMTPAPTDYGPTASAIAKFQEQTGPLVTATYIVKKDDTVLGIMFGKGLSLRMLCSLNQPYDLINCAGCNLDSDTPGCRPALREGQVLYVPGATPTPTITPTLTRSETPTATPGYAALRPIAPTMNTTLAGPALLMWMPAGVLQPDEFYLVAWYNAATGVTQSARVRESTFRLPLDQQPTDGDAHLINWQVWVARDSGGQDVLLSPQGAIYTFMWASR